MGDACNLACAREACTAQSAATDSATGVVVLGVLGRRASDQYRALMYHQFVSEREFDGQGCVVVDLIAQVQRSLSPPAVGRNAKPRRIVQPRAVWSFSN